MVKNLSFLFAILLICGCSSSKQVTIPGPLDAAPVVTGSVVNAPALEKGGVLVIDSFKPGTGAAADDETDQLSRMMIKGIKDTLPEDNTRFTIAADAPDDSGYLLDGYIEDYGRKGQFAHLSVDGQIWLRDTEEKIFLFQTSSVIDIKVQDPKTAAYQMGVAIAHFIGSKV